MCLTQVRKQGLVDHLRPDGKTQVTVITKNAPVRGHCGGLTQHAAEATLTRSADMIELVNKPTVPAER